jgi:cell shape-determining protein MreC
MILVILYFVLSLIIGLLGRGRKMGFWGYFFCSLFFSPFIALLLVLASDKPKKDDEIPEESARHDDLYEENKRLREEQQRRLLEENRRLVSENERLRDSLARLQK